MNDQVAQAKISPLARPDPWSLVAPGYNATTRQFLAEFSEAGLARLRYGPDTNAIDIACGPGTTALLLAPQVKRVTCVDFSAAMLDELRRNAANAGATNIDVKQADGQKLPFADAAFDIGVSMFGLMFFPDRAKGFAELRRVLRPGGQALVSSWASAGRSPLMQAVITALADDDEPATPPLPSGLEVPEIFEREMTDAGFRGVRVLPVTRAVDVVNIEDFWRDTVRGTAPLAMFKQSVDAGEWAAIEKRAVARLRASVGPTPTALASTAWLATGHKE